MRMGKHRFKRGETMSETLMAILLVGLAVCLLAVMVGASSRMLGKADQKDAELYQALRDAETAVTELSQEKMVVTAKRADGQEFQATYWVYYYGAKDVVVAYNRGAS